MAVDQGLLTSRRSRVRVRGSFSNWRDVLSGVPQGSVLGPLLFLIFVNDLPEWIKCSLRMFADDTKIWTRVRVEKDGECLQRDLDSLERWSDEWLLKFNCEKCKVMHIGHKLNTSYLMTQDGKSRKLDEIREERDLGVVIADNLKPGVQCGKAAAKAMSVLGIIKRHFNRLDKQDFLMLYKAYVLYCIVLYKRLVTRHMSIKPIKSSTKSQARTSHVTYNKNDLR